MPLRPGRKVLVTAAGIIIANSGVSMAGAGLGDRPKDHGESKYNTVRRMMSSWLDTSTWQVILLLPISVGLTFLFMFISGNARPIGAQARLLLASSGYFFLAGMTVLIGCWELRAPDASPLSGPAWTVVLFGCIGVAGGASILHALQRHWPGLPNTLGWRGTLGAALIGAAIAGLMALPARA